MRSAFDTKEELANAIKEKLGGTATVFIGSSGAAMNMKLHSNMECWGAMECKIRSH